jgi:hypothetical protein
LVLVFFFSCHTSDTFYKRILGDNSLHGAFLSLNIEYQDSIYRIALSNVVLRATLDKSVKGRNYDNEILNTLKNNDALRIDSVAFLEIEKYIVTPQQGIDTIYKCSIERLLSSPLFNNRTTLNLSYSINDEEEKYIIDILFRNHYVVHIDDETGCLVVERFKE